MRVGSSAHALSTRLFYSQSVLSGIFGSSVQALPQVVGGGILLKTTLILRFEVNLQKK